MGQQPYLVPRGEGKSLGNEVDNNPLPPAKKGYRPFASFEWFRRKTRFDTER